MAPLVVLALGAALAAFLTVRMASTRGLAWPAAAQIVQRISTDEGAQELYAANPALAQIYSSRNAFLDAVRASRDEFGSLPANQPPESREAYLVSAGLDNLRLNVRGTGGAWLTLSLMRPGLFTRGVKVGEGIVDLGFAASVEDLRERRQRLLRAAAREESLPEWGRFREIVAQLGSEEGVDTLLKDSPQLAQGKDPGLFKASVRAWRPSLEALPTTFQGAREFVELRRIQGPGSITVSLSYRFSQGSALKATWKSGKLVSLEFSA